jgi:hypothetical protein
VCGSTYKLRAPATFSRFSSFAASISTKNTISNPTLVWDSGNRSLTHLRDRHCRCKQLSFDLNCFLCRNSSAAATSLQLATNNAIESKAQRTFTILTKHTTRLNHLRNASLTHLPYLDVSSPFFPFPPPLPYQPFLDLQLTLPPTQRPRPSLPHPRPRLLFLRLGLNLHALLRSRLSPRNSLRPMLRLHLRRSAGALPRLPDHVRDLPRSVHAVSDCCHWEPNERDYNGE